MRCFVLLPCYNEADNISDLVKRIHQVLQPLATHSVLKNQMYGLDGYRIIAVNDGSTDSTMGRLLYLAKDYPITVLRHQNNQGLAEAYRTLLHACKLQAEPDDAVVMMDADGTQDPYYITGMLVLIRDGCDVVVASRYKGAEKGVPWYRRILSKGINMLLHKLCGVPVKDCTCGFRCYRVSVLEKALPLESEGFEVSAEVLVKLAQFNPPHKIIALPFTLNYGVKKGASKLRLRQTVKAYLKFLWKYGHIDLTTSLSKLAHRINPRLGMIYDKDPVWWNDGMMALIFLIVSFFIYYSLTQPLPQYLRLLGYIGIAFVSFTIQHVLRRFWIFQK